VRAIPHAVTEWYQPHAGLQGSCCGRGNTEDVGVAVIIEKSKGTLIAPFHFLTNGRIEGMRRVDLFCIALGAACTLLACGAQIGGDAQPEQRVDSISISPGNPILDLALGSEGSLTLRVTAMGPTGARDISNEVTLSVTDPRLLNVQGMMLSASGNLAGKSKVSVTYGELTASAEVWVKVHGQRNIDGLSGVGEDSFSSVCESTGEEPLLLYPAENYLLPPNLNRFAISWQDTVHDIWQVRLVSDLIDIEIYTQETELELDTTLWSLVASSHPEAEFKVIVSGALQSQAGCVRTDAVTLALAKEKIAGGIYYWATSGAGGIIRYDFGRTDAKAEVYYTVDDAGGQCVGCHMLSRDGKKMALTFEGGEGDAAVIDVETKSISSEKMFRGGFKTFTPDGASIVASAGGVLNLIDDKTGAIVAKLDTGIMPSTMPDFSPNGKYLAYVRSNNFEVDWSFAAGEIVIASFGDNALSDVKVLVPADEKFNNYYPTFSPDGRWLLFNRSSATEGHDMDSYSDPGAELWVISVDGGTPIRLARANGYSGWGNSWPRWAPFRQSYKNGNLLWFTFSSIRDYGSRVNNTLQQQMGMEMIPQIWMAAFDPAEAAAGRDPSTAAFWLPFQDATTNNHIAQWVEQVVDVK
jgi:hypothetical protein